AARESGARYLGLDEDPACVPLERAERERLFDGRTVQAAWRTVERSIDPRALAALYRQALAAEPKIRLHTQHRVARASPLDDGRIALEEGILGKPRRSWLHRFKLGTWISLPEDVQVPSVTVVLGPFGDVAQF